MEQGVEGHIFAFHSTRYIAQAVAKDLRVATIPLCPTRLRSNKDRAVSLFETMFGMSCS